MARKKGAFGLGEARGVEVDGEGGCGARGPARDITLDYPHFVTHRRDGPDAVEIPRERVFTIVTSDYAVDISQRYRPDRQSGGIDRLRRSTQQAIQYSGVSPACWLATK